MKKNVFVFMLLFPACVFCQTTKTDQINIWLMNSKDVNGNIHFDKAKNITPQKGYNNQPCYSNDNKIIFYTSKPDTSVKTTIYAYAISTGQTKQVTFTNMSPYSPMPSPVRNNGISVLMVEEDSSQHIWQYPFNGANPYRLFPKRDSIGYYAWIDAHSVIAYILGSKNSPNRLSLIKDDGTEKKLAENIGRGMKVMGNGAFFIQKKDSANYLAWTDFTTTKSFLKTPGNSEFLTVYKNYVLMASGGIIYGAKMKKAKGQITSLENFAPLQDLSSHGFKKITRMAVSPDGKTIAMAVGML